MTPYILPNKTFFAKISLKSIPGLAPVEALPLGVAGLQPDARRDGKKIANDSLHPPEQNLF